MQTKVNYEWSYEVMDEDENIDSDFADKVADLDTSEPGEICLVRNEGNEADGLQNRYWAYVKNGKLPECFEDGLGYAIAIKVPKRFHKEIEKYLENKSK